MGQGNPARETNQVLQQTAHANTPFQAYAQARVRLLLSLVGRPFVAAAVGLTTKLSGWSDSMAEFSVVAAVTTPGGTDVDGERESAQSDWQKITLSGNERFNPNDPNVYSVECISQRGDTDYQVVWDDYTPVVLIPGLTLPRTISFRTTCRSPKVPPLSNIGVSGSAHAKITARSIVIPG